MGRVSTHITAGLPKPHGREAVWAALRKMRGPFTLDQLCTATNRGQGQVRTSPGAVQTYLLCLQRAGLVERLGPPPAETAPVKPASPRGAQYRTQRYRLAHDPGPDVPRVRRDGTLIEEIGGQTRIWRAIRALGRFSYADVVLASGQPEKAVRTYLRHLNKAGYFRILRPSKPGTPAVYQLIEARYHGPAAPRVTRLKGVYDPNTGEVVWTGHETVPVGKE